MVEAAEKKADPPAITWDSHTYVDAAPESLVRDDDLSGAAEWLPVAAHNL